MLCAVLVIAGTTSVGKTDLSLELAKLLDGEVISADSVQVSWQLHKFIPLIEIETGLEDQGRGIDIYCSPDIMS